MVSREEKTEIAFVCQRYGLEVNGGAELYCRQVAEKLTRLYDVTVYTTCAIDYVTWRNEYKSEEEQINGVHVKRFPVKRERDTAEFGKISEKVFFDPAHTDEEEERWIDEQGPLCPMLIETLAKEHERYQVVFFMTYLYYTTARGLPLGFHNAILIPTVHDEEPVRIRYYDNVFKAAKAIVWNTEEEKNFANRRFPFIRETPGDIVGLGIECPVNQLPDIPKQLIGQKYVVYAGRIDESKGCKEMFRYFQHYKEREKNDIKLVLMGKPVMKIPNDPDIISLGFVSEEMKFAVMRNSIALVLFSRFESLSMVVLESMLMERPVLVTGHCEVLKGHCIRSNAGLYFNNYNEFAATLNYLLKHPDIYEVMRKNAKSYVENNFQWDVVIKKYQKLIGIVAKFE